MESLKKHVEPIKPKALQAISFRATSPATKTVLTDSFRAPSPAPKPGPTDGFRAPSPLQYTPLTGSSPGAEWTKIKREMTDELLRNLGHAQKEPSEPASEEVEDDMVCL